MSGHFVLAADPMLAGDIGLVEVLLTLAKVVVAFAFLLVAVMLMIWFERKLLGGMHQRFGPTIAGPFGVLQTMADGIKLFFKEDLVPDRSDRFVFKLAPYLSLIPAFLAFAIVPLGGDFNSRAGEVEWWGRITYIQVADPPVGILLFLAMSSVAVYGVMLAGWSSGSKYPLLGSVRASAQMVSYEAALGLAVASIVLVAGGLSTHDMVVAQAAEGYFGIVPRWNVIVTGLVPFIVFAIAGTAELNRPPFDLVEAEQELVGGFHTEYSSIRFALFFLAEFMNTITVSAVIVTLFLGGPSGPALVSEVGGFGIAWAWGVVWFFLKLFVLLFCFVWMRATLPRFRYDQLMNLGWKLLIPVALGWFLFLAALEVSRDRGWNTVAVTTVTLVAFGLAGLLLAQAVRRGQRGGDPPGGAGEPAGGEAELTGERN
ncbi:MAG: NADH-quinone oxidoreductase subunit H [Acidimicrobiaceae bacterium]|nr:NADH-quinone oxidoreductase subunit H [Acidimicrobiaceae bacterium]